MKELACSRYSDLGEFEVDPSCDDEIYAFGATGALVDGGQPIADAGRVVDFGVGEQPLVCDV